VSSEVFGHLRKSLHDHLCDVTNLASTVDDRTVARLARAELPRLVTALRALLEEHKPDQSGRCPTCRSGPFSRRLPAPCRAYLAAHLSLAVAEDERPTGTGDRRYTQRLHRVG